MSKARLDGIRVKTVENGYTLTAYFVTDKWPNEKIWVYANISTMLEKIGELLSNAAVVATIAIE